LHCSRDKPSLPDRPIPASYRHTPRRRPAADGHPDSAARGSNRRRHLLAPARRPALPRLCTVAVRVVPGRLGARRSLPRPCTRPRRRLRPSPRYLEARRRTSVNAPCYERLGRTTHRGLVRPAGRSRRIFPQQYGAARKAVRRTVAQPAAQGSCRHDSRPWLFSSRLAMRGLSERLQGQRGQSQCVTHPSRPRAYYLRRGRRGRVRR
jgi:hypothetical protein